MNEYFEDHPSIAAEQVRWVVTRNVMGGEKGLSGSGDRSVVEEGRLANLEKSAKTALKIRVDDEDTTRIDLLGKRT
jgi:hypothetical protein